MRRAASALVVVAACGRVGFDPAPASDGRGDRDDARAADAPRIGDGSVEFDVSMCPASYDRTIPTTGYRIRIVSGSLTWDEAVAACKADQISPAAPTHLATVRSNAELAELATVATLVWIGLSDRRTEGMFLPVTLEDVAGYPPAGTPPWGPGEPNNNLGSEHCVQIASNSLLNDFGCGIGMSFACECDPYPDAPSQY